MNFNFTHKKELLTSILACLLFGLQPLMAQEFWSEDFSGGIPAGWINQDATSATGEEVIFVHTTDPLAVAAAALGAAEGAEFLASTAANGYVWANSDRGLAAAPASFHTTELTSTAIDCSGQDNVFLRVEGLIGVFDLDAIDNAVVRVSTDGDNWTAFTLFPGLTTDVRWSENPFRSIANISDVAANQSTVYLQFYWMGGWEYFWAIDDISLSTENPAPPVDLQINSPLGPFYAIAPNAVTPASQVETFGFLTDVANIGSQDQTNVNVNVSIFEDGSANAVFSTDLDYGTVTATEIVQNQIMPDFYTPAAAAASYTGRYTISSDNTADDAFPDNNTQDFTFIVSDNIFAKDMGATREIRPADSNWNDGDPHSWAYGNCYHVPNGDGWYVDHIEMAFFQPENIVGQQLTVWLYKWSDDNGDGQSQESERTRVGVNSYVVQGTEGADIVNIELFDFATSSPDIELEDNTNYLVMLDYTSPNAETDMLFLASDAIDYSAMSFLSDSLQAPRYAAFLGIGGETEYRSTGFGLDLHPIARLAIRDTPTANEEIAEDSVIPLYPNPANGFVTASLDLENVAEQMTIRILDTNGRTILTQNHANVQDQQFTFNVSKWANGTYYMHFITAEGTKTQRFIVQQ